MQTILSALREILGTPNFYQALNTNRELNYGAMLEYFFAGCLVLIVVGSIFKILRGLFNR